MLMEDIKIFLKNEKELETLMQRIQPEYRNRIWVWKMCNADNEKKKGKEKHPRVDKDRRYVSRKKRGGRGLASIEDCVDASIQGL